MSTCALLLVASSMLATAPAHAEESASAQERSRELFARGAEAYRQGRFDEAISLFQTGDRLSPRAAFAYNLAVVLEARGDTARALEQYRAYLRRSPDAVDRAAVEGDIGRLEGALAAHGIQQVTILTRPVASVAIDGIDVGLSPWTGELSPGSHALVVGPAGGAPVQTTFELPPDRAIEVRVDTSSAERPGSWEEPIAWSLVGFTGAALSAGTVLGLVALDRQAALDDSCGPRGDACPPGSRGDIDTFRTTRTLSYVSFGAALASSTAALLLFTQAGVTSPTTEIAIVPRGVADGAFVTVRSSF